MVSMKWPLVAALMLTGILPAVILSTISFEAGRVGFHMPLREELLFLALFALATPAVALLVAGVVGKPLRRLTDSVDEISRGNLKATLGKSGIDEVQSLTDSLSRIIASLKLAVLRTGATTVDLGLGEVIEAKEKAEHEAKKEQDKAQKYLNLAGVMFVANDASGKVTMVNRKACDVLGYDEEEIVGKNFTAFLPKETREEARAVSRKLLAGKVKSVDYYENPVLTKSGEERLIAWHNSILKNERGAITGTLSSGEDITEHRRAEEALVKSQAELEESQRIAQLGRWHLDLATNALAWSPGIYTIFGMEQNELGASYEAFLKAIPPDDRKLVDSAYKTSVKERKPYDITHRIVRPGGEVRWVREICETSYDRKGKPLSSTGTVQDVTQIKKAEEQLRVFFHGFDNSPNSMLLVEYKDEEPGIVHVNKAFTDLYGYTEKEVTGKNPGFLATVKEDKRYYQKMWRAILDPNKGYWWDEIVNKRKNGSRINVILTITTIFDEQGKAKYFIANHIDVTKRKSAEEALKRQKEKYEIELAKLKEEIKKKTQK